MVILGKKKNNTVQIENLGKKNSTVQIKNTIQTKEERERTSTTIERKMR